MCQATLSACALQGAFAGVRTSFTMHLLSCQQRGFTMQIFFIKLKYSLCPAIDYICCATNEGPLKSLQEDKSYFRKINMSGFLYKLTNINPVLGSLDPLSVQCHGSSRLGLLVVISSIPLIHSSLPRVCFPGALSSFSTKSMLFYSTSPACLSLM